MISISEGKECLPKMKYGIFILVDQFNKEAILPLPLIPIPGYESEHLKLNDLCANN